MPGFNVNNPSSKKYDLSEAIINFNGGGNSIIIPGKINLITRIFKYFFIVGGSTIITPFDGTNALTGGLTLATNEGIVKTFDTRPWYTLTAGNDFILNSTNAVLIGGRVYFTQN